jgi:hypothetical protein
MSIDRVAILGSSPLCLLRAASEASRGRSVTIYEKSDTLGGAWCPRELFGVDGVDGKSHIWAPLYQNEQYEELMDELRSRLGIRVEPLDPAAVYPAAEGEASSVGIAAFYPVRGMIEPLQRLEEILRALKVVVLMGHTVTNIGATSDAVIVHHSSGEDRHDVLYLPSYVGLATVDLDEKPYAIPFTARRSVHLNVLVDKPVQFSYLEAPDDLTYVDRLCDISRCFQNQPGLSDSFTAVNARVSYAGKNLLANRGREKFVELAFEELVNGGYLDRATGLVRHDFTNYTTAYRDESAKRRLYALKSDRVKVMYTEQLMEGLRHATLPPVGLGL